MATHLEEPRNNSRGFRYLEPWNKLNHTNPDSDAIDNSCMLIEDIAYEMEIEKHYRKLQRELYNLSRIPSKKMVSKAVQTNAEVEHIPSSWLIAGSNMASDLHNRIGNMINKLYHIPDGYCRRDEQKTDTYLKHFTYVDGNWQSKLCPHLKIPSTPLNMRVSSERFKEELNSFLELASKLNDLLLEVSDVVLNNGVDSKDTVERERCISHLKIEQEYDVASAFDAAHCDSHSPSIPSSSKMTEQGFNLHFNYAVSDCGSESDIGSHASRTDVCKSRSKLAAKGRIAGPEQKMQLENNPGVIVYKYKMPSSVNKLAEKPVQEFESAGTKGNAKHDFVGGMRFYKRQPLARIEKEVLAASQSVLTKNVERDKTKGIQTKHANQNDINQENSKKQNAVPRYQKNFIKRNILATKSAAISGKSVKDKPAYLKI